MHVHDVGAERHVHGERDRQPVRRDGQTDPGVRGDTVSGGTKPATTETGLVVQVPLFLNTGDRIKVDTRTGAYIERA